MATCTEFIQPLNFECILLNTFAESHLIFIFLSYLFIATLAAYFKMGGFMLVSLIFLYSIIISTFVGIEYLLILLWIVIAMVTFSILSKIWKN